MVIVDKHSQSSKTLAKHVMGIMCRRTCVACGVNIGVCVDAILFFPKVRTVVYVYTSNVQPTLAESTTMLEVQRGILTLNIAVLNMHTGCFFCAATVYECRY